MRREVCIGMIVFLGQASVAVAQLNDGALDSARSAIRDSFDPARAGSLYAASINFTVHPDIATASFRLDGLEDDGVIAPRLDNYRVPLRYSFEPVKDVWTPFLQGTVGYQDLSMGFAILGDEDPVSVDWRSRGIDIGAGLEVRLSDRWTLIPTINLGVADLSNKADYGASILGPIFQPVFEGIVFDWDTNAWVAGGGLAARFDRAFESFDFHVNGSLSTKYVRSFDESSADIVIDDTATTADLELNTIHPMGSWGERPWSLVTILGFTSLLGEARGELGFDDFVEAGLAVQIDASTSWLPLDKLRIGLKVIGGPDVSGLSLIVGRGI